MNKHTDAEIMTGTEVQGRATLLATVKGNQTIAFVDEATGDVIAAPVVGTPTAKPHEIILSNDGKRAFVSLYGDAGYPENTPNNQVAVIDVEKMELETVIGTDLYEGVHGLAKDHLGRIWLTSECNQCILVIDPDTLEIEHTVFCETRCHFICPSRDGRVIYSAHKEIPYLGVHDAETCKMIDKIALDVGSQAIWHAPDKDLLYVGDFFRPLFHVVDTVSRKVIDSIELKGVPGWPYATPDGKYIVVSTYIEPEDRGFAEIFDAETLTPVSIVELPAEPFHVLDGNDGGKSVLIVVGDGRLVRMDIATGGLDALEYPLGAAMPEQVIRTFRPA